MRGISSSDHPAFTVGELAVKITEFGSDRYDSSRRGVSSEYYEPHGVELHAIPCNVCDGRLTSSHSPNRSVVGELLVDFITGPLVDRGAETGLRIDVILVYDRDLLVPIVMPGATWEPCEFRFLDAERRVDALLAVIEIG